MTETAHLKETPLYPHQPPPPHYYQPPPKTNTLAIVALVMLFVFSPASIVLGIMARKEIKRTGEQGWGMATASLVIGSILSALGLAVVIIYVIATVMLLSQLPN